MSKEKIFKYSLIGLILLAIIIALTIILWPKAPDTSAGMGLTVDPYSGTFVQPEKAAAEEESTGGQLLNYVLSYKGQVKNPNASTATVVLETVAADDVYLGFQGKIGVKVGTAKAAGTYTDTLTFSFKIVEVQ